MAAGVHVRGLVAKEQGGGWESERETAGRARILVAVAGAAELVSAVVVSPAPARAVMSKQDELKGGVNAGWFLEVSDQWPGQAMAIKVTKTLFEGKSAYQDIKVFETETYGKMMTIDGVIQSTQRDEFAYHEMMAHLPMFSHPNPEQVCVIGGGDGGVLREVVKHPSVKRAVLCDIDDVVIAQSKAHLKHLSCGFEHPNSQVMCCDGLAFLKDKENAYDVIIIDSSDPDGPASALFGEEFYRYCVCIYHIHAYRQTDR